MKKLSILLAISFLAFSCNESELIIPGEDSGTLDTNQPTQSSILKTYTLTPSTTENNSLIFQFDTDGKLNSFLESSGTNNSSVSLTRGEEQIESLSISAAGGSTASGDYTVAYDDSGNITTVTKSDDSVVLTATYTNGNIALSRVVSEVEDYTFQITRNGASVTAFSITSVSANTTEEDTMTFSNGNVNAVNLGETAYSISYDDKSNPLSGQLGADFLYLLIYKALIQSSTMDASIEIPFYSTTQSQNNLISSVDAEAATSAYAFTYSSDDMPMSAIVTNGETVGALAFTYYE